jgi:hypothetical protein
MSSRDTELQNIQCGGAWRSMPLSAEVHREKGFGGQHDRASTPPQPEGASASNLAN